MTNRRSFLIGAGAFVGAMGIGLPRIARAETLGSGLKFIFVFNQGGWDPTRVFADQFDNDVVAMEPGADRATAGGIGYVDHPMRPSVRTFLEQNHADTVVLNGLMVRSIAHEICTMIAMTGTSAGRSPDWPAILGAAEAPSYTLPHLVINGPSFPGNLGVAVARTGINGQLESLLAGDALDRSDIPVLAPSRPAESLVDRYLLRRARARADGARSPIAAGLTSAYRSALEKAAALKDLRFVMDFTGGNALADQAAVAVEALQLGVSRCVTLSSVASWDTHANNDVLQTGLWEDLFNGLGQLMTMLRTTPGDTADTLAEETMVVVLSEMGRTPNLNDFDGKDHWPYTSAMLVGPGLTGSRVVGSFDDYYYGRPLDPGSAEVDENGQILSAESLGATLLAMADVDPGPYVAGVEPITGILS